MATSIHCGSFFDDTERLVYPSVVLRDIEQFDITPFICAYMGGVNPDHPEDQIRWMNPVIVNTDEVNADMIYYDNAMDLCRVLVPDRWARWKREDVVITEEDGAKGMGDKLAWYNNL